jgi:hypothetical protein
LNTNPDVSLRVQELQLDISNQVIAGVVARQIGDRNARLTELQARWDWLRDQLDWIVEERGAELAEETAGGGTGLLFRHWVPANGDVYAVYRVDPGVLEIVRLLLEHEKRAAEELGQWGQPDPPEPIRPDFSRLTDEEWELWKKLFEKTLPPEWRATAAKG